MEYRIDLTTDKKIVVEGDIVEVVWSCVGAECANLTLDNGFKSSMITVSPQGSKKFRLNRSKRNTIFSVSADFGGKIKRKSVKIKVKRLKVTKTENVTDHGARKVRGAGKFFNRLSGIVNKFKIAWGYMPENKRLAYKILLALSFLLAISTFWEKGLFWGVFCLGCYLFWILFRR